MRLTAWRWWLAGVLLLASGGALAQRTEGERAVAMDAYASEVAVRNQTEGERRSAFGRGLALVLAQVTGDGAAGTRPGVREELANAATYVDGYDYRQDEGYSANGSPTFKTILVTRFRRAEVDALVDLLGLPVWPMPRARPVLWLAIDDGSGARLVGLAQANAARALLDQAKARGFALGLPAGSAAEQAAVGAIWRADTGAIAMLSQRYSPPIQLLGKLYRDGGGWMADWILLEKGRLLSKWSTSSPDARRAMSGGADGAAEALFKRYARAGNGGAPGRFRVRILDVGSADDYMRLIGYLEGLSIVKRIEPVAASAEALDLDLELATGMSGFARYVERAGMLLPIGRQEPDGSAPQEAGATSPSTTTTMFRLGR